MKIYHYPACSTCKRAIAFLKTHNIPFEAIHIVESPPSPHTLSMVCAQYGGNIRKLLNTSGELYRSMNIKDRLPGMAPEQLFKLLSENGKLIKRPILIGRPPSFTEEVKLIGFNEEEWKEALRV